MLCLWLGPPGFNFLTSVTPASGLAVEDSSYFISVINLDLYVHCFDSLMSRSLSRRPNYLYIYIYMNHGRTKGEVGRSLNRFKHKVIYYCPFQADASVVVYSNCQCSFALLVFDLLFILFRIALWPSAGKEQPLWLFICVVLILVPP